MGCNVPMASLHSGSRWREVLLSRGTYTGWRSELTGASQVQQRHVPGPALRQSPGKVTDWGQLCGKAPRGQGEQHQQHPLGAKASHALACVSKRRDSRRGKSPYPSIQHSFVQPWDREARRRALRICSYLKKGRRSQAFPRDIQWQHRRWRTPTGTWQVPIRYHTTYFTLWVV